MKSYSAPQGEESSGNAGSQYKSCKVFDTLSKIKIPVLQNCFGAKHGKGEADSAIGCLSQIVDAVVHSGTDFGDCIMFLIFLLAIISPVRASFGKRS